MRNDNFIHAQSLKIINIQMWFSTFFCLHSNVFTNGFIMLTDADTKLGNPAQFYCRFRPMKPDRFERKRVAKNQSRKYKLSYDKFKKYSLKGRWSSPIIIINISALKWFEHKFNDSISVMEQSLREFLCRFGYIFRWAYTTATEGIVRSLEALEHIKKFIIQEIIEIFGKLFVNTFLH